MTTRPMTTRPKAGWAFLATALLALLLVFPALAKGSKTPNLNNGHGKITALSAGSITVTPKKNGEAKTFTLTSSTKVKVDGAASTTSALAVGQSAHIKSTDGTTARAIKVSTKGHRKHLKA